MVFRLLVGIVGGAVAPAISSKTGLSIEYVGAVELIGDLERFMFVKRLIRLTVVDEVEDVLDSFLAIPFEWLLLLLSILHCGDAACAALLDLRPKNASTCWPNGLDHTDDDVAIPETPERGGNSGGAWFCSDSLQFRCDAE